MKLLFVANDFPNPYEPTKGVFNLQLARALSESHDLQVVSPISWVDEWKATRAGFAAIGRGRRTNAYGFEVCYPRYYYPPGMLRRHYGSFYWNSVRRTVRRLIRARPPDAVLGYWVHPDGDAAVRAARTVGVPAAVIVGGSDVLLITKEAARRRRVLGVLQAVDAIVTVSADLKETIAAFGIDPGKIHVWSQGVDAGTFFPGDRQAARREVGIPAGVKALLWVGRMVPVKGLEVFIQSCGILRRLGVEFHAYMVGDGPLRAALEAEVAANGLADRVMFVGSRTPGQLGDWFRAADLTVLPSWSEGLPNVLRESQACGTSFVASRVGGIAEIAGSADRLVPPGDAAALADAIANSLASRESNAVAAGGREGIRPLTWAESAAALIDIVRSLTPARPAPHIAEPSYGVAPI